MKDIEGTDRFVTSEDALVRELDGESVILDLRSEQYFGLDEVGALIWERLDAGDAIDAIVAAVVAAFEVEERSARADLTEFVGELLDAGLITRR